MKSILTAVLFAALSLTLFYACSDDGDTSADSTSLELNFKLSYDGSPLPAFQEETYPLGYEFFLTKLSFFLTNAELISGNDRTPLFDAAFLDLLDDITTIEQAERGVSIRIDDAPVGEYNAIRWNIGVDSLANSLNPSDYPNDSALALNGEYWVGWASYIFHKIEGKIDAEGNGSFGTNVALHIGSNDALRSSTIMKDIVIEEGQDNVITFTIDFAQIVGLGGEAFDLQAMPQVHQEDSLPMVLPLMDNLARAIQ